MTTNQSNEHQRRWSDRELESRASKGGNYDRTREHLNFEVAKGGVVQPVDKTKSIHKESEDTLSERGIIDLMRR